MTAIPIADSHTSSKAIFQMAPVALTIIFAYVYLYWCQQPRRRRVCCNVRYCGKIFVQFVAILGPIITLLAVYELMLLVQAHIETGVKGKVLSLFPSFPLSGLGWYLKGNLREEKQLILMKDMLD